VQKKKDAAQAVLNDAKQEYDKFQKEWKDAKTQKTMLPIILTMTSGPALAKLQKLDNFMNKPGEPDAGPDAAAAAFKSKDTQSGVRGIYDNKAKEFYITQMLSSIITPFFNEILSVAMAEFWNAVDFGKTAAQSAIMGLVGAIPFVGGVLAALVAIVFDAIWVMFEHHVNAALLNLGNTVCNKIIAAMAGPIVKELSASKDPSACKACDPKTLAKASTATQTAITDKNNKKMEAQYKAQQAADKGTTPSLGDFKKMMSDDANKQQDDTNKLEQEKYTAAKSLLQLQVQHLAEFHAHPLLAEHRMLQAL
jgi:hypothetical protein